jgi:hypothetical protein
VKTQATEKFCLFRRSGCDIGPYCKARIVSLDRSRVERHTKRTRLSPEIKREMRPPQSVDKLAEAPHWRLTRPKDHQIGRVGPILTHGQNGAKVIDRQFLPPRCETTIPALRRRLRGVIIEQQTPGRDLAETEPIAVGKHRVGCFVGPIDPEACRDEPEDRRFAGPVETGAPLADRNATHGAEWRMEQEDEVLTHGSHTAVAKAIASASVPSPPTFMV